MTRNHIRSWLTRLQIVPFIFLAVLMMGQAAPAEDLTSTLRKAVPGSVISLPAGDYGELDIQGLSGAKDAPIILKAADPADPPRFSKMVLREVKHFILEDAVLDYRFAPGDPTHHRPFQILDSSDITLRRVLIDGDVATGRDTESNGFPIGYGLNVIRTDGFRLEDSEIRNFHRGLVVGESHDLAILRNDVHSMRSDGMNFAQVEQILIEGNHIHDFNTSKGSKDHPDMIQFWTNGTKSPSVGIVIRNNVLNSGRGHFTQSIFMRNDLVDRGLAGKEMFYRDIIIEENVIINAHLHGITVGETNGLIIRHNTVLHNALSDGEMDNPTVYRPQIRVSPDSVNVVIKRNVATKIAGWDQQPSWKLADNYLVQDVTRAKAGFYSTVFTNPFGDPSDLSSFFYKQDGPLGKTDIGASRLRAK